MPRVSHAKDLGDLRTQVDGKRNRVRLDMVIPQRDRLPGLAVCSLIDAVRAELARQGLLQDVALRVTGCLGFCEQGPMMVIEPGNSSTATWRRRMPPRSSPAR